MLTVREKLNKLKELYDPDFIVELAEITSEELVDGLEELLESRLHKFDFEEEEENE